MDVELLSKMVKELVLDNDKVSLPGLGAFVAEVVPSTFSDKGYTINPPYRKLSFRTSSENDTLLQDFYASNNNLSSDVARQILETFSGDLKAALETVKVVNLPGLGRLRSGRDGNIFFVADEELDIYPAGFGLEPVSLKTHSKPASFDFSTLEVPEPQPRSELAAQIPAEPVQIPAEEVAVAPETSGEQPAEPTVEEPAVEEPLVEEPAVEEPVVEEPTVEEPIVEEPAKEEPAQTQDVESEAEAEPETEAEPKTEAERELSEAEYFGVEDEDEEDEEAGRSSAWKVIVIVLIVLVLIAAILVGGFFVMADMFPDLLDKILYTEEELEILRYIK